MGSGAGATLRDVRLVAGVSGPAGKSGGDAMSPRLPTIEQILDIAGFYGMQLTPEDAASFRGLMAGPMASYARLDQLAEPKLPVSYPRAPGYRPGPEENKYNAWYWKT